MRRRLAAATLLCAVLVGCSSDPGPVTKPDVSTPSSPTPAGTPASTPATTRAAATGPVRYVALGDSVTSGEGLLPEETYPSLLADLWRGTGCEVELSNVAVTGYKSEDVLIVEVPPAVGFEPTVATLMVGGNDIANGIGIDAYRENVRQTLATLSEAGADIVTVSMQYWDRTPFAVDGDYGTPEELAAQRAAFNQVLVEEGEAVGATYVDLSDVFEEQVQQEMWQEDQLHPTAEAYVAWADGILADAPNPCGAG